MKMRRLLSCMMALLLAASMPLTAFAVEADVSLGDVSIGDTQVSHTTSEGAKTEDHGGSVTVIQSNPSTSTNHSVSVNTSSGSSVNVTLKDVNIDTSGANQAAVEITGSGDVVIELDGNNTVKSGEYHAGVEKNDGDSSGKLTITDENGTDGSLKATGGQGAAGIGGGYESSTSNITISDGAVDATGGEGGAGIGGGAYGAGSGITIKGGTVDANGGTDAAGIGGGERGNGSDITISGGTITAIGGDPMRIINDDGTVVEAKPGGGAGIGGGAYGSGDNIAIKNNAQVTATGQGNAANIGNGYASEATEKQKDKVDLSGLSLYGKVNGVSGSEGSNLLEGSGIDIIGSSNSSSSPSNKSWPNAATYSMELKVSDNDGNDLSNVIKLKGHSELEITAKEDKVSVSGNKADLLQLTVEGVNKINLKTNRVNVSVSNEVLNKITGTGGSFQLSTDNTTVNLSATDRNNKKTLDMNLTANKQSGTQAAADQSLIKSGERLDTQAAPDQNAKKPEISIGSQSSTGNNSEGGTLQVTTTASDATLSLEQKYLQSLQNSEFSKLALDVANVIATVDCQLAALTAQNGSGSISIGETAVEMNGMKLSARDSSDNDHLSKLVSSVQLQVDNQSQGGSAMVVEVDAKASVQSASLEVPGNALQSLMDQGVEETALSVNGKTTSIKNSNLREQTGVSQSRNPATITVKDLNILVP